MTSSVPPEPVAGPVDGVSVDDSDPAVRYSGSWTAGRDAAKFGGADHYTDERGASAELTFTGSSISVRGARAPWHGDLTVKIDGVVAARESAYAPVRADDVDLFSTSGLTDAPHTVEVVAAGSGDHGAVIALDRFVVGTVASLPAVPAVQTVDDGAFSYRGPWSTSQGSSKYGGGDHYSDGSGATATLTFTGTAATVLGARAPWHGRATYSVDGGAEEPLDLYAVTRSDQQPIVDVSGLAPGRHVLRLTVTGLHDASSTGAVVSVDGAEIRTGAVRAQVAPPAVAPPAAVASSAPAATASSSPAAVASSTPAAAPTTSVGPPPTPKLSAPTSTTKSPGPGAAVPSWVTRSGSQLEVDGEPFKFSGANLYWLGLDDNIRDSAGLPTHPTQARIDNGLSAAVSLGMTVIRSHSVGISVGCANCVEPTLGVFDDSAFASADYALYRAGQLGLRMIIPLTDQWRYYHGGISTFTSWRGYPNDPDLSVTAVSSESERDAESNFYTDPRVVGDFEQYIAHVLDHVNPYTGLAWKNDPTVMAWETGNELWTANPAWTQQIAAFIKHAVGARALVADGSGADGMHVADAAIDAPDVDMVSGHFYPVDTDWARSDAAVAAAHGKVYFVGEYAWTDLQASAVLLSAAATDANISGDLVWSILPRLEDGTPEKHDDGYALYAPATTDPMRLFAGLLTAHARVMAGR